MAVGDRSILCVETGSFLAIHYLRLSRQGLKQKSACLLALATRPVAREDAARQGLQLGIEIAYHFLYGNATEGEEGRLGL